MNTIKIDGPDKMFHPSPNPRTIAHVARTRTPPPPPVPRTTRLPRAPAAALNPPDVPAPRRRRSTRPTPRRRHSTRPTRATPLRRRSSRPTRPRPGGGRGTRRRHSTRPTPRRRPPPHPPDAAVARPRPRDAPPPLHTPAARRAGGGLRPRAGGGLRPRPGGLHPPDAQLHPASPTRRPPDARPGHRRSTAVPSPAPRPPGTAAPGPPQRRRAALQLLSSKRFAFKVGSQDAQHKREEMNRKKREYRARKKAEANHPKLLTVGGSQPSTAPLLTSENVMLRTARTTSNINVNPTTPTTAPLAEQRKRERRAEINEEQRIPSRKKAEAYNLNYQNVANGTPTQSSKVELTQPSGGSCSTIVQQSVYRGDCSMIEQMEKENIDPDDPTEWLHRNDDYVRRCQPNNYNGGSATTYITPVQGGGSSKEKKLLINRHRYINMEDSKKAKYLRDKQENMREPRKRMAGDILTTVGTPEPADGPHGVVTQEEMMCEPSVQHRNPGEGYSDTEFDSELYEPTHLSRGIEVAHGEAIETCNFENYADEETRHYLGDQGDEFESYRVPVPEVDAATTDDPYDFVYQTLPKKHMKGKIKIHIPDVRDELKGLFTSQEDDDAKYFRKHIRYFNSHFSFTSLGVTLDKRVSNAAGTGIYTFRVHGGLYHRLDHLVPGSQGPRHLQLYFYDTEDDTLSHRVRRSPDLDINLIRSILIILQDNPYVQSFTRVGSIPNLDDYRIELNTNVTPDQRRYNAPTASQVAAIWLEGNDPQRNFDRSVIVYAKGDRPHYIRAYHGCYDPLAYPLFFPRGETG
ncbi:hypothetical protein ACP4OV_012682 [Aristida adscensionis]